MLRPRISTNLAISADGKISPTPPRPSGWTSRDDHARLLELRAKADAILVGRGTLESDRMTLTVPNRQEQPLRCIVSGNGMIDPEHPVFRTPGGEIHLLVTGEFAGYSNTQVTVHQQTLLEFLHELAAKFHIHQLHCEGGGRLIRTLAELDLIDEFHLTLAGHTVFGGFDANTATGIPDEYLSQSRAFEITRFEPLAGECFLSYTRRR